MKNQWVHSYQNACYQSRDFNFRRGGNIMYQYSNHRTVGVSIHIYIFLISLLLCTMSRISGQTPPYSWGFYHRAEPLVNAHPHDYFHATGEQMPFAGIGAFSIQPRSILPKTLFHLYAFHDDITHHLNGHSAVLRLQTAGKSTNERPEHKTSSIEFRVGEISHPFGLEEQVCALQNVESSRKVGSSHALPKQRGLSISVQKQGKSGTEQDGMLDALYVFSERRTGFMGQALNEWYPRIGIGNAQPLEHLQLGSRFTFHAGGASRIGDNLYYDMHEQQSKRIVHGAASSIGMHQGSIILSNALPGTISEPVSFEWGDIHTLRGIEIDSHNGMSIGKRYPQTTLDIMSRTSDEQSGALRIQNSNHSTLLYLTSHGSLGIYNAQPKERVHIGETFTIHAGGASVLGDNVYVDSVPKSIKSGRTASLIFQDGLIQLANTDSNPANSHISYRSLPLQDNTVRGIIIENKQGHCGIGITSPKARLDILATPLDTISPALRVATIDQEAFFTVNGQGNVGIGIPDPKHMLQVAGNVMIGKQWNDAPECSATEHKLIVDGAIIARELLITSDYWADEVFEDSYQLMTLHELEHYIKTNKHLPNMPTESEIHDSGMNVSKVTVALLRKIEELTLHILTLNKDIARMNNIIDTLPFND